MNDPLHDSGNRWLSRLTGAALSLLILAGLGGLAWWGHHTGWGQAPSHRPQGHEADPDGLADVEVVAGRPRFGWCEEHGVHDCPLCHPEAAELRKTPAVTAADRGQARRALDFAPRPANDPASALPGTRLRFGTEAAVTRAALDFAAAYPASIEEGVAAPAEVAYDATRYARLSARAGGSVWQVYKQVGDAVKAGEVLALIDAPEVGRARADFAQALLQVEVRTRTLDTLRRGAAVVPEGRMREAETTLKEAQVKLATARQLLASLGLPVADDGLGSLPADQLSRRVRFLGLPVALAATLGQETATASLLPVVAPLDGEVLAADVVAGEVVESGRVLAVVGDPRRLWLRLAVKPEEASRVRPGQAVRFRANGLPQAVGGPVEWVSPTADEATRTVEVRVILDNSARKVRVGTLGQGRVVLRTEAQAVQVPREAILRDRAGTFVLVRDRHFRTADEKVLHVRSIRPGAAEGDQVEVVAGLAPGEVVVTKGAARLFDAARRNLPTGRE